MPPPVEEIGRDNVRYFGVWHLDRPSHRLWAPDGRELRYERTHWDGMLDMTLCPRSGMKMTPREVNQPQGASRIHHRKNWTALAFWDRTGDARFHSNSVFLAYGTHDLSTMLKIAAHYFPEIWDRVKDFHFRLAP